MKNCSLQVLLLAACGGGDPQPQTLWEQQPVARRFTVVGEEN